MWDASERGILLAVISCGLSGSHLLHFTNFAFGVRTKLVHEFTKRTEELDCLIWCVRGENTMHDGYKCDLTLGENGSIVSL
jgi:hypothetical protein